MDAWLEELFVETIWEALKDFYVDIATWGESEIENKLKELKDEVGKEKPLSTSPVVKVVAYETTANPNVDQITFLIRGRIPLFKGVESVFMRVQLTISTDVDLLSGDYPITVVDWHTIIGDLIISKKNVFFANLGFGYDDGVWLGRGALKILPAGFGLDIFLGGLSDRGAMVGLSIDLPAPIPLGSTGLGLAGMGGDFAYNFIARLEKDGAPVTDPTAKDYIGWARNTELLDRWQAGPVDQTAVGVGINTDLVTLADNGRVVKLEPIGLAVLTPGPVFVLGGVGKLLDTDSARIEGYIAVDIPSASLALGLGVRVMIPKPKSGDSYGDKENYLVDAQGVLDAYFSFKDPSTWYVNLGTADKMIGAKIITDIVRAELFFNINNNYVAFGAGISIGGKWSWWIITLTARIGADVAAKIGWNPVELEGMFMIWAELGLKIWKFGFLLRGEAKVLGHTPEPSKLETTFAYKLDLPWPIPDIKGEKTYTLGDETPVGPTIASPLMAGQALVDGTATTNPMAIGLLHTHTGRQWETNTTGRSPWPDAVIVVPFSCRATDETGSVVGSAVSAYLEGGYQVSHTLKTLALRDISGGAPGAIVPGVKAIWAAGPDGDTGRLHINDEDPFSWVVPHGDVADQVTETPPRTVEQLFGFGPEETFTLERRFDEMFVAPKGQPTRLVTDFQPQLLTRVLESREFRLRFATSAGAAIHVDEVTLYLVVAHCQESPLFSPEVGSGVIRWVGDLYESLKLVAVTLPLSPALDQLTIYSGGTAPLLVFAVRYREARQRTCNWSGKVILKPGKYQISLSGESKGVASGLPDSKLTTWQVTDTFDVDYPERLRPYIDETTIGDSRIFDTESKGWNPTMYGFGFPIYQDYYGVVRFHVSYMDQIFALIRFRLIYERGGQIEQDLVPSTGGLAKSWLLDKSKSWISGHCGTPAADQEITLTNPFSKAGAAGVHLLFDHPNGQEVKLDEWSCYVSQFGCFADHLHWPNHCLTVLYSATGRTQRPCCPTLGLGPTITLSQTARLGNRIDPLLIHETKLPRASSRISLTDYPLLLEAYPFDDEAEFPAELAFPPASWRLPATLTGWLQPLDELTGERFARFAAATGAQFNGGGADTLAGINDTVGQTAIEAVVDSLERPYALWLRTPEPVDWRRVTATLRIRHVTQTGSCPTGYEERLPLDLSVDILPSPDATSAFLVGSLNGERTRLPRGEYELKLRFDTQTSGLPVLKPRPVVGGTVEEVTLKFIQPAGQRWPQPASGIVLPAGLIDKLARVLEIHWPLIDELLVDLEHLQTLPPVVPEPGYIDPVPERIRPEVRLTEPAGQLDPERLSRARLVERLVELDEARLALLLRAVGEYDLLPVEPTVETAGEMDTADGGEG